MNLNELLSTIKAEAAKKESSNIKTFILLKSIKDQESWKKFEFYDGTELNKYALQPFAVFIRDVCGFSITWYENMQSILELRNGKTLLKKYGFGNMVTYLNTDKPTRKLIIEKAEKCETSINFRLIKNGLTPRKARRSKVVEEENQEVEPVKVDRDLTREMSKQLDEAGERIEKLKAAVSNRDEIIKNLRGEKYELLEIIRGLEQKLEAKNNYTPSFLETITSGFFGGREARS